MAVIKRAREDHFTQLNRLRRNAKTGRQASRYYRQQRSKGLTRLQSAAKTAAYFGG